MKHTLKPLAKYILTFLVLFLSLTFLLFLVSLIPNRLIQANVDISKKIAVPEFAYALDFSNLGAILDKPTESIMLERAVLDPNRSPFSALMEAKDYARYWHGYLLVLRPLLVFTDLTGIYYFNMFVFYGLLAWLLYLIAIKLKPIYAVFLMLAMVPAHFYLIPCCMQYIGVFIISFITSIIILYKDNTDIGLLLFITGCLTSFFDFLTAPLITLILPLSLYMLKKESFLTVKQQLLTVIKLSFIWGIGYVCFWAAKWLIGSFVLNRNVLYEANGRIKLRAGLYTLSRPMSVIGTVGVYFGSNMKVMGFLIGMELISFIVLIIKKEYTALWKLIVQCIPLFWYFFTANHSLMHDYMTYRNVIILVFLCEILALQALVILSRKKRPL